MEIVCVGAGPGGLYFAILAKRRTPAAKVAVVERNSVGAADGWGVTLSDHTLDGLYQGDRPSAELIQRSLAYWGDRVVLQRDPQTRRLGGYGFAVGRWRLLEILTDRATALGVEIKYDHPVTDLVEFADVDLVVGADGANSRVRQLYAQEFCTTVEPGGNCHIWLGTRKVFGEFTFAFERTDVGWIWFYAYPFDARTSTFIVECARETWCALGFDRAGPDECVTGLERIFAMHLCGHPLMARYSDGSPWRTFIWVTNEACYHSNVVVVGDAAHTTHFSTGQGMEMAIDDALELDLQLGVCPDLPSAMAAYQRNRAQAVRIQRQRARDSATWFERLEDYIEVDPTRFSYALRTRTEAEPPAPARARALWLLHRATQFAVGRRARNLILPPSRRQRARERRQCTRAPLNDHRESSTGTSVAPKLALLRRRIWKLSEICQATD